MYSYSDASSYASSAQPLPAMPCVNASFEIDLSVDTEASRARFRDTQDLVAVVVRQFEFQFGDVLSRGEMESLAHEGLLLAARRYDPSRGVPFRSYAAYRVRGAILDGLRHCGRVSPLMRSRARALQSMQEAQEGFAEETKSASSAEEADKLLAAEMEALATTAAVSLSAQAEVIDLDAARASREQIPERMVANAELIEAVRRELDMLPAIEADFIRRHFFEEECVADIARSHGMSKSWGSRLLARALSSLTRRVKLAAA